MGRNSGPLRFHNGYTWGKEKLEFYQDNRWPTMYVHGMTQGGTISRTEEAKKRADRPLKRGGQRYQERGILRGVNMKAVLALNKTQRRKPMQSHAEEQPVTKEPKGQNERWGLLLKKRYWRKNGQKVEANPARGIVVQEGGRRPLLGEKVLRSRKDVQRPELLGVPPVMGKETEERPCAGGFVVLHRGKKKEGQVRGVRRGGVLYKSELLAVHRSQRDEENREGTTTFRAPLGELEEEGTRRRGYFEAEGAFRYISKK